MPRVLTFILAGGRVNELGVLTYLRPKSTMPYGGLYRIIDFPLSNLMNSGLERVGILCQYRSSSLLEHIGNGCAWDMHGRDRGITLLPPFQGHRASDWYKGTADAVYQNMDFIERYKPELVLILSGDHVYHMDYNEIIAFHMEKDADCTCAFVKVSGPGHSRFGEAVIEETDPRGGRILGYREKPATSYSPWASMTIYLFKTDCLLKALEENSKESSHEFGRDILPKLYKDHKVFGYKFHGYWAYSRTLHEYWQANMDLLDHDSMLPIHEWNVRTNLDHEEIKDRGPSFVGRSALVQDARFHNGARIEGTVRRSILFPGVVVGEGAVVEDSILFFDTQVGPGAKVTKCITDIGVTIGKGAQVGGTGGEITVIGAGVQIPQGKLVEEGEQVPPCSGH